MVVIDITIFISGGPDLLKIDQHDETSQLVSFERHATFGRADFYRVSE